MRITALLRWAGLIPPLSPMPILCLGRPLHFRSFGVIPRSSQNQSVEMRRQLQGLVQNHVTSKTRRPMKYLRMFGFAAISFAMAACTTKPTSVPALAATDIKAMSTGWCSGDPLPNPLPATFKENYVQLVNKSSTSEHNQFFPKDSLPKRVWCFVRTENTPGSTPYPYLQCSVPSSYCAQGSYMVINLAENEGFYWLNFTNQHSDLIRTVRVVWEP